MQNPWDVRPKQPRGDHTPDAIYLQVGAALTAWETLESLCAELFDAIVAAQPSNRAAFSAFSTVKSASARTELIEAAAARAVPPSDPAHTEVAAVISAFGKLGGRRNEIAHGSVYDLEDHGFYLAPNNIMRHKWSPDGAAKYQYTAADISHYVAEFVALAHRIEALKVALVQRDIAARKTDDTRLRRNRDGSGG